MSYTDVAKKVHESEISRMVDGNLRIASAVVIFKNFTGAPTQFNPNGGKRTFSVCLTPEWAEILKADGWNVRQRELEEGDTIYFTEIVVNENSTYPPHLYVVTEFNGEKKLTLLSPEYYNKLDQDMIINLDLEIHPFEHGRGVAGAKKGYLKNLWATLQPVNDFGGKYSGYTMTNQEGAE